MNYFDNIPDDFLKPIGAISVNFARLEFAILWCISYLNCSDMLLSDFRTTLCLAGGENFDILLSKLDKLFRLKVKNEKLRKQFNDVRLLALEANDERNRYLHSHLSVEKDGKVYRIKFSKKMSSDDNLLTAAELTLPELEATAEKAFRAGEELFGVIMTNLDVIHLEYQQRLEREINEKITTQTPKETK